MVFTIFNLVEVVWIILPAFAVNGLIPLVRFLKKTHAIDGGREWRRKPIFGSGKTWEGLIFGSFIGVLIATIMMLAHPYLPWDISTIPLTIIPMTPLLGLLLGIGTVFGDMAGSFIKRRIGLPRGAVAPLLDQLDFLLMSLLFASFMVTVKLEWVILLVVITPIIHLVASFIGYKLKVKREPW